MSNSSHTEGKIWTRRIPIPVTLVGSDIGVQNTYIQFIEELLWRMWQRRLKFTLQYGVPYFLFCVCQDKIVLCSISYGVIISKHENKVYTWSSVTYILGSYWILLDIGSVALNQIYLPVVDQRRVKILRPWFFSL